MKSIQSLDESVRLNLQAYFTNLGDNEPSGMWNMVMSCVEKPLLESAMKRAEGNQSRAAQYLGITRNTLRKKLLAHKLIDA
ncbi:helix-turn-helix domain-containing protein [Orrella sp. 11846]|uniref:helix-turn-helix domain-containing protein n=1 Tax=Orrella sp. 11846 TaxID=3409913 RepID=UPI003B592B36